jgi:hypothetical protein
LVENQRDRAADAHGQVVIAEDLARAAEPSGEESLPVEV